MSRTFSLYVLLALVLLIGVLFYQIIEPYVFVLLFSLVLAVLFRPFYDWMRNKLGDRYRLAALLTALAILLVFLLPLGAGLVTAGMQLAQITNQVSKIFSNSEDSEISEQMEKIERSRVVTTIERYYRDLPQKQQERIQESVNRATDGILRQVYEKTIALLSNVFSFVIGLFIVGLALYYLFSEGHIMVRKFKRLLPLADREENALIDQFGRVCRGVIMGTVIAALVQALLAGVAYLVAGTPMIALLTAITMFCAFIPFVGGGTVVVIVGLWMAMTGETWEGVFLVLYGLTAVALTDNVIRAYVIGSEARMNPLIALITVLGGIQLVGLWGIFVGPMIAAFFYTSLKLLHDRLEIEEEMESHPGTSR